MALSSVIKGDAREVQFGMIHCEHEGCRMEFPIIDGIPILHANVRGQVDAYLLHLIAREDLPHEVESLISDAAGPGSAYDSMKQAMSSYAWDHYEFRASERSLSEGIEGAIPAKHRPGSASRCLSQAIEKAGQIPSNTVALDVGCATGGTTFDVADKSRGLVLGVDLNFSLLRIAARVLREGRVVYPRRQGGVVYERRELPVSLAEADQVDFWCCDACCLPLGPESLGFVSALNVLDCVPSPLSFLKEIEASLVSEGKLAVCCPYDWSPAATPLEEWLGGHSQRGQNQGDSASILEALLTPGALPGSLEKLRMIDSEPDIPWSVRVHARSFAEYQAHLVVAQKCA